MTPWPDRNHLTLAPTAALLSPAEGPEDFGHYDESDRIESHKSLAMESQAKVPSRDRQLRLEPGLFSTATVLNLEKLIFAGSPLSEVLTNIAQLVESEADGMFCTIWLPDDEGKELYCVAAPALPGFIVHVGRMLISPQGGSCGTAVYRQEPVYMTDILTDPAWDLYRDRVLPFGIRSVWSRPLFTREDPHHRDRN